MGIGKPDLRQTAFNISVVLLRDLGARPRPRSKYAHCE